MTIIVYAESELLNTREKQIMLSLEQELRMGFPSCDVLSVYSGFSLFQSRSSIVYGEALRMSKLSKVISIVPERDSKYQGLGFSNLFSLGLKMGEKGMYCLQTEVLCHLGGYLNVVPVLESLGDELVLTTNKERGPEGAVEISADLSNYEIEVLLSVAGEVYPFKPDEYLSAKAELFGCEVKNQEELAGPDYRMFANMRLDQPKKLDMYKTGLNKLKDFNSSFAAFLQSCSNESSVSIPPNSHSSEMFENIIQEENTALREFIQEMSKSNHMNIIRRIESVRAFRYTFRILAPLVIYMVISIKFFRASIKQRN